MASMMTHIVQVTFLFVIAITFEKLPEKKKRRDEREKKKNGKKKKYDVTDHVGIIW
jgi:hypothetical protein